MGSGSMLRFFVVVDFVVLRYIVASKVLLFHNLCVGYIPPPLLSLSGLVPYANQVES